MRDTNDHKEIQKGKCSFFNRNSYLNCQWAAPVVLKCEYKLKKIKTCHSNVLFFNRHLYINIVMVLSFICHCICVLYFLSFGLFPSCVLVFLCSFPSLCFPPHLQCFSFLIPALFLVLFPSRVTPHQLH